jgi:hypothetical protein
MAMIFKDEVIASIAIDKIKDNLLNAEKATGGAIKIGKSIAKGDFIDKLMFGELDDAVKRDPNIDTPITAKRLGNRESTAVKLYYKNPYFATLTELERYGTSMGAMQANIADSLADSVTRFILQNGLTALVAAIESQADLTHTAGGEINFKDLNAGVFKFGDQAETIKTFVAPSVAVGGLIGQSIDKPDTIAYGAIYKGVTGTLGRNIWMVDSEALTADGIKVLGLSEGALQIDESEVVKMITNLNTNNENTGYDFRPEGAYTIDLKGYSYKKASGANPDKATLGSSANYELIGQAKKSAGVLIKGA